MGAGEKLRNPQSLPAFAPGAVLIAAIFLFMGAHASGPMYKWTDANGVVQYSDQPHEGAQALSVSVHPQIRILSAAYGANIDLAGSRDNATQYFRLKCDGHPDCSTRFEVASVTAHGDPYFGHDKTLDIVYACVMASGTTGPAVTVHIGERAERLAPQALSCISTGQSPASNAGDKKMGSADSGTAGTADDSPYGRNLRQVRKSIVGTFTELQHCRFEVGRQTLNAGSLKVFTTLTNVSIAGVPQPTEIRAACTGDVRCMQYTRPDGSVSNENQLKFETSDDGIAANRAFSHLIRLCGGSLP
jgi:hypothetical protein